MSNKNEILWKIWKYCVILHQPIKNTSLYDVVQSSHDVITLCSLMYDNEVVRYRYIKQELCSVSDSFLRLCGLLSHLLRCQKYSKVIPAVLNPVLMMPRNCVNHAYNFCYICGEVTFAHQRKAISVLVKRVYHLYFGCKIGDQDKSWAPHIRCIKCATNLTLWLNGKRRAMSFAVPMVWREPGNHTTDCNFCMVPPNSRGFTRKMKWTITYPNIPSAVRPVPYGEGLSIPRNSERIYHRFRGRGRRRGNLGFSWTEGVYW